MSRRLWPWGAICSLMLGGLASCSSDSTAPQVAPESPPGAPAELRAREASVARIVLDWRDRSTGELGFRIERRPAGTGEFARVDTVAANVGTYTDRSVQAETTYDYRVVAYRGANASGAVSAPSNQVTVVATNNAAPTRPSSPTPPDGRQSVPSDTSIALSWSSQDNDGDTVSFDVFFGANRLELNRIATGQSTTQLTVAETLEDNRTYFWRVDVSDARGLSRTSPVWSFSTPVDRVSVPGGRFVMGDTTIFTHPGNPVNVVDFNLDRFEVTNQQYANFLNQALELRQVTLRGGTIYDAAGQLPFVDLAREEVGGVTRGDEDAAVYFDRQDSVFAVLVGRENFPVIQVSWYGANAFAVSQSRELPTESQWEKAARGTSTDFGVKVYIDRDTTVVGIGYPFPWGDAAEPAYGNFADSGDPYENLGRVRTTPVGFYDGAVHSGYQTRDGASIYGARDLGGNVWEWCGDWFDFYKNPHQPPNSGNFKVVRGASYREAIGSAHCWNRSFLDPGLRDRIVGFRTAGPGLLP